jgi:hypothetical protein
LLAAWASGDPVAAEAPAAANAPMALVFSTFRRVAKHAGSWPDGWSTGPAAGSVRFRRGCQDCA